jgi:hypothetical protein
MKKLMKSGLSLIFRFTFDLTQVFVKRELHGVKSAQTSALKTALA